MTRWPVIVAAPGHTFTHELHATRSTVVGQGEACALRISGAGLAERHVSLLPRSEGVLVEPLRDGGEIFINDVPVTTQSLLKAGDELRLGEARLIFTVSSPATPALPRVVSGEEFFARLPEEVRRAGVERPLGLAFIASAGMNVAARQALQRRVLDEVQRAAPAPCFGEVTPEVLGVLLPELSAATLATLFKRLPEVAGPRAQVGLARTPEDGLDAGTLAGCCWDQLLPFAWQEPLFTDAAMVRLDTLAQSLSLDEGPVCAVGAPGSGRRTLMEVLAQSAGRRLVVASALDAAVPTRLKAGDWLLLRDADAISSATLGALLRQTKTRVLATAQREPGGHHFAHVFEVPPLAARPDDIAPLAEAFVSRARLAVGRPRLTLSRDALSLLQAWRWPGNVRELKNVLARAARGAVRDEIGRDALPPALTAQAPAPDFRGAMQSAERELLLETLARTRWNVTAAATRLDVPRRTLVHRMAKLGLKRPAR